MNRPDWKDAPEWAQWVAQDDDGSWVWYAEEPECYYGVWDTDGQFEEATPAMVHDTILESRPTS